MKNSNFADALESYIIEDSIVCEKISLSGLISKLPWIKSKELMAKYSSMTDEEIARRLVKGLKSSRVRIHDDTESNTKTALRLTTMTADSMGQKYNIYRFDKSLVLVIQKDDPDSTEFNVWADIPKYGNNKLISTPKKDLIKSFIKEDK